MIVERAEAFDAAAADVWNALRDGASGLHRVRIEDADDANRTMTLAGDVTFWTLTTLGQRFTATVVARGDTTEVRLTGRPRVWSLTAGRRITQVHEQLLGAIRANLTRAAMR